MDFDTAVVFCSGSGSHMKGCRLYLLVEVAAVVRPDSTTEACTQSARQSQGAGQEEVEAWHQRRAVVIGAVIVEEVGEESVSRRQAVLREARPQADQVCIDVWYPWRPEGEDVVVVSVPGVLAHNDYPVHLQARLSLPWAVACCFAWSQA